MASVGTWRYATYNGLLFHLFHHYIAKFFDSINRSRRISKSKDLLHLRVSSNDNRLKDLYFTCRNRHGKLTWLCWPFGGCLGGSGRTPRSLSLIMSTSRFSMLICSDELVSASSIKSNQYFRSSSSSAEPSG